MEVPDNLKDLYKHWDTHTKQNTSNSSIAVNTEVLNQIYPFIIERMLIWESKVQNKKTPYTKDKILSKYKFCNIYRELDRQTIEIHSSLKFIENEFELWLLNIIFHRMVCKPSTIKKIGLLTYKIEKNKEIFKKLTNLSKPKYGVPYIFPVSLLNKSTYNSREEFFCLHLPKITKKCAEVIKSFENISVVKALVQLLPVFGFNFKFHWTEVLIDVAYQYPHRIDLYKQFPIGPGAVPTMKKLNIHEKPEFVCMSLINRNVPSFPYLTYNGKNVRLSAENWEGIGCEFRKYSNLLKGKGRRRLYKSSN